MKVKEEDGCDVCGCAQGEEHDNLPHNELIRKNSIRTDVWNGYVERAKKALLTARDNPDKLSEKEACSVLMESFIQEGHAEWRGARFIFEAKRALDDKSKA